MKITAFSVLPLAVAALGGAAFAQPPVDLTNAHLARPLALTAIKDTARPPSISLIPAGSPLALDLARRDAGLARTGVDQRLSSDDVVGSLGFLCGRQPGPDLAGSAAAFGSDPHGRFLGAKLAVSF